MSNVRELQRVELFDEVAAFGSSKAVIGVDEILDAPSVRSMDSETAELGVPFSSPFAAAVVEGDVTVWRYDDGFVREWRVVATEDSQSGEGDAVRRLQLEGIKYDLAKRAGVVRLDLVGFSDLDYRVNEQDASTWLDHAMSSDEFPVHFKKGTVESGPTATIDVDGFSPLEVIDRIEERTGLELEVDRDPSDGLYWLHLRSQRGQDADPVLVALGRNLVESTIVSDVRNQATRITPRGGGEPKFRATLAEHRFEVDSIASNVVTLKGTYIKFDRQLGGPNLLGDDAFETHDSTAAAGAFHTYRSLLPIANIDVAVSDLVTIAADLWSDTGADDVALRIRWFNSSDVQVDFDDITVTGASSPTRISGTFTVPATTAKITVEARNVDGTEPAHARRASVSRTDGAIPFIETAPYLEKPNGTLTEIYHSKASTQELTVASAASLSPGDLVVVRRDSAGNDLLSLIRPTSVETWGPIDGILDRQDAVPVDNLLANGFLEDYTGGVPDGVTVLGGAVVSQHTGANKNKGTSSLKVETAAAGDGVEWAVTVETSATRPYFVAQALALIESIDTGADVKVRIEDVTNGGVFPAENDPTARADQVLTWLDFRVPGNKNFHVISTTQFKVRVTATGVATFYLDAAMLLNQEFYADEYSRGRVANELWTATNDAFDDFATPELSLDLVVLDVYRSDSGVTFNELVVGGDVIAKNDEIGLGPVQARIVEIQENGKRALDTSIILSARREDIAHLLAKPNRNAAPGSLSPKSSSPSSVGGSPPVGAGSVQYDDGQTVQALQPAQADADVTGQNTAADVVAVGTTLASSIEDGIARALDAITVAGDLDSNVLIIDGSNNLVLARGRQPWTGADGGTVTFSPAFQSVPAVFNNFPKARYFLAGFISETVEAWDGAAVTVSNAAAGPVTTDHTLAAAGGGQYVIRAIVKTKTNGTNLAGIGRAAVALQVDPDGVSGFTTVDTFYFGSYLGGNPGSPLTQEIPYEFFIDDGTITSSGKFRFSVTRSYNASATWSVEVDPQDVRWVGGLNDELVFKIIPNGLDVDGFTLVAKIVERNISVSESSQGFATGTITAEGQSKALASTLADDADDDEYRATYDGTISINSADTLGTVNDTYPAGVLVAAGENKQIQTSAKANNDQYTNKYDVSLHARASGSTPTSDVQTGSTSTPGATFGTKSLTRNPGTGSFTTFVEVTVGGGTDFVEVSVESNDGGAGWVEETAKTFTGPKTASLETIAWTNAALLKNDQIRLKIKSNLGSFTVAAVKTDYGAYYRKIDFTVKTEIDKGAGWVEKGSTNYSVTDEDGVENALVQAGQTHLFTDAGLNPGHKVRTRLSAATYTGAKHASEGVNQVDPVDVSYTAGAAETASIQVEVALDSKDGAGSWVEKDSNIHTVEDSTGTGTSLVLTDALLSFFDSAIDTGDDLRIRIKSIVITGNYDSSSVSIDPDTAFYNTQTGTTTEYTMTPETGDVLQGIALGG